MAEFIYDVRAEVGYDFDSDAIEVVAYNRADNNLFVRFTSGGQYIYLNIAESTYNMLVESTSLGRFFREHIMNRANDRVEEEVLLTPSSEVFDLPSNAYTINVSNGFGDNVSGDSSSSFTSSTSPFVPSRWGVKWDFEGGSAVGPFEPEVTAWSEADAVEQVKKSLTVAFGDIHDMKILAVTHHFVD